MGKKYNEWGIESSVDSELRDKKERQEKWSSQNKYKLKLPNTYIQDNPNTLKTIDLELQKDDSKVFIIMGSVGSGKTLLANIIADSVIPSEFRRGMFKYVVCMDSWRRAKEYYSTGGKQDEVASLTEPAPFMIIDDLGAEDNTEAGRMHFVNMLTRAYDYTVVGKTKLLVITTNLGIDNIEERYGERVRSRLDEIALYCLLNKKDYRKEKRRGVRG